MTTKPTINVTPLIDVLLVLLIIFMVITPLKPTDFKAKIPQESKVKGETNPLSIVVAINRDSSLRVNTKNDIATVGDPENLVAHLSETFRDRKQNQVYSQNDPTGGTIEKTVFIKAPRSLDYGQVAKVIDAVKLSGAEPIALQIDDLND